MAVSRCKIGAASADSCAEVVHQAIDKDDSGMDVNYAGSGLYLIAPAGLSPKLVSCQNDQLGGSYTVIQKRMDGSENFNQEQFDFFLLIYIFSLFS